MSYYGTQGSSHMNWALALCLAAGGLCCLAFGMREFTMGGNEARAAPVREYDAAVDYWNAVGRSQFTAVSCVVSNLTGSGSYTLAQNVEPEVMKDSNPEELHEYTPLSYSRVGSLAPGVQWDAKMGTWRTDVTFTCSGGSATAASSIVLSQLPIYKTDIIGYANQKQCLYQHKGSYINGNCQVYYKVKQICVKVSLVNGFWALNNTWGGSGCHSKNDWKMASYKSTLGDGVSFGHGQPPVGPIDLESLEVRVRSGLDPFVDAEQLTQDSMDFGATSGQEATMGIILLVLGVLCMVPFLYRIWEMHQVSNARHARSMASMASMAALTEADEESEMLENEMENPLHEESGMTAVPMGTQNAPRRMASTFGGMRGIGQPRQPTQRVGL